MYLLEFCVCICDSEWNKRSSSYASWNRISLFFIMLDFLGEIVFTDNLYSAAQTSLQWTSTRMHNRSAFIPSPAIAVTSFVILNWFGKTVLYEFPISYSHTEWYLLPSRNDSNEIVSWILKCWINLPRFVKFNLNLSDFIYCGAYDQRMIWSPSRRRGSSWSKLRRALSIVKKSIIQIFSKQWCCSAFVCFNSLFTPHHIFRTAAYPRARLPFRSMMCEWKVQFISSVMRIWRNSLRYI